MDAKNSPFLARLDAVAADTEALLERLLAAVPVTGEISRPARLAEAMRYVALGGGKRFRPFLVVDHDNGKRPRIVLTQQRGDGVADAFGLIPRRDDNCDLWHIP